MPPLNGKAMELVRVLVTVAATLLTLFIWSQTRGDRVWSKLHEIEVAVASINASRFTSNDGQAVWQEFSIVRQEMALLPKDAPPLWFEARVNSMEIRILDELKGVKAQLTDLTLRVQRLETLPP